MSTSLEDYSLEVLFEMAADGVLPEGFNDWSLSDEDGWTIGDEAATYGQLPEGFDQWSLADENEWTIAHSAAGGGKLPKDFHTTHPDVWILKDIHGLSVEVVARMNGYIVEP